MLPDRVSNPGPLTYESDALPIALRGPATELRGLLYNGIMSNHSVPVLIPRVLLNLCVCLCSFCNLTVSEFRLSLFIFLTSQCPNFSGDFPTTSFHQF